ncbi:MAG: ABC transporter permease, partial [Desulfovibrio sp.]|nr:ABC transporter permease [Desulfovibrio sp.]
NPVWHDSVRRFAELVRPLLPNAKSMSDEEWQGVCAAFGPYGDAIASRPAVKGYVDGAFAAPDDPAAALDALGDAGVERLLAGGVYERFLALCEQDLSNAAAEDDIRELEKLVLYYCHLHRLLRNFVSFLDFYDLRADVTFRAGTLYMDGRSCDLCLPVDDVDGHAKMATMSQLCLLYCLCTRRAEDGTVTGTRTIVAAVTAGSDDVLIEGRNGVFVDNTGADWDAKLLKVVHNPISFSQATWAPYKRISQMIGQAVSKFAADKSAQGLDGLKKGAADAAAGKAPAAPFDISKGAGIFAAVGLALGAIGTAVGSIANALFSLSWWQFPLLLVGIFAVISGPSVFLAWLKFRRRTLGPVLEASGWAVNTQLPINLKLGGALTRVSKQPDNMERPSILDPFRDEEQPHTGLWITLGLVIAALALGGWLWMSGRLTQYVGDLADSLRGVVTTQAPEKAGAGKADAGKSKDAKADKAGAKEQKAAPAPASAPEKKESAKQGEAKPNAGKVDDGKQPDAAKPKADAK